MNEELERLVGVLQAQGASMSEIQNAIAQYKQTNQGGEDSNEEEVPTGPTVDADGVNVDTYIDETFWEVNKVDADGNKKLDRDSYFDEQGNFIQFQDQMRSDADYWLGYEKVLKEMETKNAVTKDAVMVEDTSSEGFIQKALEGEDENISNAAQTKYNTHVQQEIDYNNITDEERQNEAKLRKEYLTQYVKNGGNLDYYNEERLMEKDGIDTSKLPSKIESEYEANKNNYFNQKLTIAKRRWLKETGYKLDSPEGEKLLEKLEEVTLADIEGDEIKAVGKGEQSLATIFNSISNDDAEFKEAVLDTERTLERNTILRSKTSEMADAFDKSGTFSGQLPGNQTINALFGKSVQQVTIEDFALKDLETIESEAKDKSIEASLIHEQYNRVYDKLTETAADLKEIGDPKVKIEAIKAKHDLTTDKGIKAANEEITGFIDRYSDLVNDHNNGSDALKDISLAVTQIKQEMGDLAVREQDLGVFTDQIGKNHRVATQMATAFANATVDLAEGAADVVYMVNPLGALADELIDYAGEDSYLGTVVETARILAAPFTGGASMYSGKRRDDIKDAINGYQEHVSSLVAEPPRYDDIQGVGDAVEWALVAGATQAPQLAILAATGGTAGLVMMGAMSAGQKFSAMEDQRELFEKTGGLYGQDHNFATMYAASVASGAIESLSEKVTLGLMKGTGGLTTKYLFGEVGKKTAGSFFRRNILSGDALKYSAKKLIDIGEEGGSEALATIGGNYIDRLAGDKTVNILSGVNESFVTGALIGSTLVMPTVFRDAHSSFKSVEASDVMEINYARIQEQNAIINDPNSTPAARDAAVELNKELVAENASVIALDLKRVDSLTKPEKKRLVEIEVENRKIEQQALEIAQSDATQADKDKQIETLNEVYNKNLNEKNGVIAKYPADEVLRAHKQELQRLQDQSDAIEAEGGAKINVTRGQSKTDEGLVVEFDAWKKEAQKKGNVRIAASEDGTQVYGAMVPVLNNAGEVTSYEMFFNEKNIFEDGKTTTASHELLHAAVFNTIRANPVLRRRFGEAIENILDGPGVKINEEARKDLERVKQYGKTARGEEIFAIVSENMVKGNITIDGGAIGKMKDLMRRTSMATTDTDIEFNDEQDIRNFLKDYSRSRTKGVNDKRITSLFVKGAKGKLVETPATREEAKKIIEEKHEEQAKEDFQETLMASMRSQPDMRQEIDDIVKNPDGTRKYQTKEDFNRRGGVESAWMKISQSPLLDGLIQQGMVERGVPPQAMRDFTRNVKDGLMERLYKQYDPAKNDSLFGWLTGVSGGAGMSQIYRAKGDVMNAYKKDNMLNVVSLDAPMGEGTSFEATIEAETDTFMQQLEEMDMTKTREAREARKPKKVVNELNIDSKGKSNIKQAIVDANLSLEGVQYKDVKKLTTGKGAPLSSVLDIIAEKFGVDPKRIIKPSDLNGKQRKAAQSFINKNAAFLLEMLPEGETVSGEATGVANTKLGELYEKGERLKFKDGATAAGKFSQQKKSDLTVEQFKELFGIKPDGTFDNNRKHDGAIKALVNQATVLAANQALRENAMENGTSSEAVIAKLGEGRAEVMFSVKVREKVKNTFDQLYPDLIKAVANSNTGDIDSIRVGVEAVYGEILNKSEINRLVNEVYDQADEYNTISQDLKSAGTVAPLSLEQFLQDKYDSANTEKGVLKALQDKLPKDKETKKTISVGAHFLTDTKINQQRAIPGLISAEMKKQLDENGNRVYSDKQIAEMLIAHVAPMYAGAGKIADGRFIVVDGVMIKDPEWDVRKDGSPGNKWRRWNKSDVKKASDKLFANRRNLLTKAQIAALGPVPVRSYEDGGKFKYEKEYRSYQAKLSTARLKARLALEPKVGDLKLDSKGNKIPKKNRKQCCQGMPDFINILNTIGLGNIQKAGRGYTLDGVTLDTTLIPETSEARLRLAKDPNSKVFENGKKQAEDARVVVKLMLDTLYAKLNSKDDYANFAMTLTSLGSSMQAPMRRAAMFEYFMEGVEDIVANKGKASIGSITEFEHLKPQEETIGEIIHSYLTNGELDMRIFEGGGPYRPYKTGVLSKDMDNAQTDAGHKFTSPSMTRGDSRQYSLEAIRDTRIRPLRSIDPAKIDTNKEFVGREWVAMNDALAEGKNLQNDKILQGVWGNISFSKRAIPSTTGIKVTGKLGKFKTKIDVEGGFLGSLNKATLSGSTVTIQATVGSDRSEFNMVKNQPVSFDIKVGSDGNISLIKSESIADSALFNALNGWIQHRNKDFRGRDNVGVLDSLGITGRLNTRRRGGVGPINMEVTEINSPGPQQYDIPLQTEGMFSKKSAKPKGISVLDFDDTLATTKSNVWFTTPSAKGLNFELNPEDFYATLTGPEGTRVMWLNRDESTRGRGYGLIKVLDVDGKPMGSGSVVDPKMDFKEFLKKTRHQARSGGLVSNPREVKVIQGVLNAEQFAKAGKDLLAEGVEFDFSEFNKVVDGKIAPLFNKAMKLADKFGTDNMFILTARSPESAEAIKQFLDAQGLNIPIENITGLGKSEASAKANWIAEKIGEGYNDFYFADDAIQNVEAVKNMLDAFDVKGKVQQAKVEFSRRAPQEMDNIIDEGAADLDSDLNIILEESKGVSRVKRFSPAKARKRGKNKGKFKFFIPPSADDFAGLMYAFMGKGKTGDRHHKWFKENLFDPFSKGIRNLNMVKQAVANDLKRIRKAMPEVTKKLTNKIGNTEYTHGDAIRVYNWNRAGFDIPGLTETDKADLIREIEADPQLKAFADGVSSIGNMPGGLTQPGEHWLGGTIASDMTDAFKDARSVFLQQWKDNVDVIFNEANMNKIEAVYGSNFREALEDILYRMEHGGNKSRGAGRLLNNFTSWIHGSIGTTMFFNARSAVLQMISNVNFINWSDNNMMQAAAAFANQPQYWKDVAMIFNSPFLKQRRAGLKTDVNAAELLADIKDSKNKMKAATAYLLRLGFTPTQIADSLAIATGGATMYRNRVKTYTKEGLSQSEAETKAFEDMMEIAEETQQSAREDRISQQQASPLGKFILAFQNTPMQYNRLIKKAAMDLVNGRGDAKANVSRIVYYGAIQNMIFYGLQQALFAALFGDDEEDELTDKKKERVINGMMDTLLRGSGIAGAAISTIKNVIMKFAQENEKMEDGVFFTDPDWGNVVIEALNISPPIGIKARKIYSGLKTWEYNNDVIKHMSKTDLDNPIYDAVSSGVEAVTNLPLNRLYNKYQNISEAMNSDHETWKRVAMLLGWSKWSFGIKNQDVMTAKNEVKEIRTEEREERKEVKKQERAAKKAEEEAAIEQGFIEDQKQEREDGKEDITCAAVNKSGKRCGKKVEGGGTYCTIHEEVEQRADNKKVQCSHIKTSGDRCKMKTTNKSGKCYYHD